MFKAKFISSTLFLLSGLNAWAGMQQHSVPLPDDDPAHNVAAPEPTPQEAPATADGPGAAAPENKAWKQSARVSGVKVDFRGVASLKDVVIKHGPLPVSLNEITSSELVEGQQAVMQFRFTDAAGTPMTGLRVAGWMDQAQGDKPADAATCHKKIQSFLQMRLSARPEVDLNTYYVLALTQEPSVLIIDPRVGFGSSKLYAVIDLAAPGADWIQTRNGDRVFITMPAVNQVATIDAMNFRLAANINVSGKPGRIALQPGGKYLWVGLDSSNDSASSGVAVIDTTTLEVAARIPTGKGRHEIAFDENQNAYVSNQDEGTISIISTERLTRIKNLAVGNFPTGLAYSPRSKSVYVAAQGDGKITIISAENHSLTGVLAAKPGLSALAITPDGRWGFVANGKEHNVLKFDVASGKLIQQYAVGQSPDQLAFTNTYLYVRSRDNEHVSLITLNDPDNNANVAEFPAGQNPPGALADLRAPAMVAGLDGDSAFVANPADKRIFYYQEGMAAPMLSMEGYGKTPKAVMVLDRSLHETEPAVYSVGLRLPKPGLYDIPVYVDSPAISHCFEFTVRVNPLLKKKTEVAVDLHPLKNNLQVKPGEAVAVQFRLTDPDTEKPRDGIKDIEVTLLLAEGLRQMHVPAEPLGDGVYQFSFTPPHQGVYYGMVQIPSLKVRPNQLPYLMVRAVEDQRSEVKPPNQEVSAQAKKQ
jgi:YVTN family beta-propeller protein